MRERLLSVRLFVLVLSKHPRNYLQSRTLQEAFSFLVRGQQ